MPNLRVILILLFEVCVHICLGEEPIVVTQKGKVRGRVGSYNGSTVHEFLGVPFAVPPVGELRFKKPIPAEPREEIDATQYGPACHQFTPNPFPWYDNMSNYDEDCLTLNIWVPYPYREGRAVFYWMFSGGYLVGSNNLEDYRGQALAATGDIIVITANYRVGAFGFLYSGTDDAPGNMGLYDSLLGLQWVHENIKAFGGDPGKVTIAGHSAGAITSSYFMVSPLSKGLFNRVILQSGSFMPFQDGKMHDLTIGQNLAEKMGCADETQSLRTSPKAVVDCLRRHDASSLAHTLADIVPKGTVAFFPVFGDPILGFNPKTSLERGEFYNVDVLIGNTDDENVFVMTIMHPDVFGFFGSKNTVFNKSYADHLLRDDVFTEFNGFQEQDRPIQFYLDKADDNDLLEIRNQTALAYADFPSTCPSVYFTEEIYHKLKVYYYLVKRRPSVSPWAEWLGVVHFDEVQYVFGRPTENPQLYTEQEVSLSLEIMKLWSNFIKDGNPGEEWPMYTSEGHLTRILEDAGQRINKPGPHLKRCEYLKSIFYESLSAPPPAS